MDKRKHSVSVLATESWKERRGGISHWFLQQCTYISIRSGPRAGQEMDTPIPGSGMEYKGGKRGDGIFCSFCLSWCRLLGGGRQHIKGKKTGEWGEKFLCVMQKSLKERETSKQVINNIPTCSLSPNNTHSLDPSDLLSLQPHGLEQATGQGRWVAFLPEHPGLPALGKNIHVGTLQPSDKNKPCVFQY